MEPLAHSFAAVAILGSVAAAGVSAAAGPVRAFVLGASTKWRFLQPAHQVKSQRTSDINRLTSAIASMSSTQYAVVTGPIGVGKTTLVDHVMSGRPGVVHTSVAPAATMDTIATDALKAITWYGNAASVVKWHRRIFGVPPTVVLRVRERPTYQQPAHVGGAVRQLVEHYKLRVVVDSSDSSLEALSLLTLRERVIQIEPMERAVLEQLPSLQRLLVALKDAGLADLVWAVLGGNPALYGHLLSDWQDVGYGDIVKVAEGFMNDVLFDASSALNCAKAAQRAVVAPLYDLFKTADAIPAAVLPPSDGIVRLVRKKGDAMGSLVPSSRAMALALRYGEGGNPPSLDLVRSAVAAGSVGVAPSSLASELPTAVSRAAERLA